MKPDEWKKIERLCHEAMALQGEERTTYIEKSCAGNPDLLNEVKSLLEQEDAPLFEYPLVNVQSSLIFSDEAVIEDQVIGPYRLVRKIASGGMGHVYLAVRNDDHFERFVALKIIRKGVVSDDVLARFYEERQILASLNHPNIARLFDGGTTDDGLPWFAMEYVEGIPITEYCRHHHCTLEQKLNLFLDICSAVQYAHQNLIVHRDLKPANILITENGHPKLLDFGIAKLIDMEMKSGQTQTQNRMLTPEYASPEQVTNESISTVSDVYSLGVLLFELLTGQLPYQFKERTPSKIEETICNEIPQKPSVFSLNKELRGDLDNISMMALKKDPSERYSSVEQFADDICKYQMALPIVARRNSFTYRSRKFLKRHRWSVAASTVIVCLVISFAIVTFVQSQAIEVRAIEAETERDRAEEISDFLINLFQSVDPSEARDESLSAVELLHRGSERVDRELADQPDLQSELYQVISDVYESLGLYESGINMSQKALHLQRSLYGEYHPEIATSLNSLGWLYHQQGDYAKSDSLLQSALVMRQNLYEGDHLEIARTLNDLAVLKQSQGDYMATDTLLSRALNIRRKLLGDNHESVGIALSNYAALKWRMGDIDSAEVMMRESLNILQVNFGSENLRVAVAMTNLAAMLISNHKIDEAEPLYREALEIRYQLVGEEHPDVAYSLAHLGNLLRVKGEYEEAEKHLLKSLELRKKLLGKQHILVGDSSRLLAYLYYKTNRYRLSEKYYLSAIDIFESAFPDGHTRTADVQHSLAEVYLEMNDPIRAEPFFRKAMATRERFFGSDDIRTITSMINLGVSLFENGKGSESRRMLESGLDLLRKTNRDDEELTGLAESTLARL